MTSPTRNTIDFNAASLDAERAAILESYGKAAEQLAAIGKRLISLKKRLERGIFLEFLNTLPFSQRTAYNFMQLAQHAGRVDFATVASKNVTIAAWYVTPPENTELVDKIMQKAHSGEKVTVSDVRTLLATVNVKDDRLAYALYNAAEESPQMVMESIKRGAMSTVQGLDLPLDELTATDVAWASEQDEWERQQRQKLHITENAPTEKVEIAWNTIEIDGAVFLCVPPELQERMPEVINVYLPVIKGE